MQCLARTDFCLLPTDFVLCRLAFPLSHYWFDPPSLSASRLTGSPPTQRDGGFQTGTGRSTQLSGLSDQNAVLVLPNLFHFTQAACMAQPSKVLRVCVCVCVYCIVLSYCHYGVIKRNTGKGKRSIAVTATHMPYGIAQCCLPPGRSDIPALTPAELNWMSLLSHLTNRRWNYMYNV